MELFNLGIRSIFIDNMIFAYFLGMCSFLAVSKKVSTAVGLGAAVVFVLGVTVPFNWILNEFVLKLRSNVPVVSRRKTKKSLVVEVPEYPPTIIF